MSGTDDDRFRALFERSPVAMIFSSLSGVITGVNPAACALFGRPEVELIGTSGFDAVHEDEREELRAVGRPLLDGAVDYLALEHRVVHPDGRVVWAESYNQLVRTSDGAPSYLQSVLIDVTERKATEEARRWLGQLIEKSQDALIAVDLDGSIQSWNRGAERIFGYTADEVIGRDSKFLGGVQEEFATTARRTRIGAGERLEYRVVRTRKNGSAVTLMVQAVGIRDGAGAVVGIATVARDLADQERAEAIFRGLVEGAPDAMVCIDEQGKVALVNDQAEHLFGGPRAQLVGTPAARLFVDRDWLRQFVDSTLRHDLQVTARRGDGSEFEAEVSVSSIKTQDGDLIAVTIRDGSERQRSAIVASSADAIVGRALDGTITSWNAAAERMYGYSAHEAIGRHLWALVPADRAAAWPDTVARLAGGGVIKPFDTERHRSDGVTLEVSVTISPIIGAGGTLLGISTTARDITESKRAAAKVRAVEARRSATIEASLDCIITMDGDGCILEFNRAAELTFGYARERAVGRALVDLIVPPQLRVAYSRQLDRYLAVTREGPIVTERVRVSACRADGSEFPVELTVVRVEVEGAPLFTGFLRDLTEETRIQNELVESERLLEAMLDHSPALISVTDLEGRYIFMNRAIADDYGIDRSTAKGRTFGDVWSGGDARRTRERHLEVLRTGEPTQYELVAPHKDGTRTYLTLLFPVFDAAGNPRATASMATDISAGKQAEAERERLGERRRQSERLESLGQLAGGVAHDFNNLLGIIINYATFVSAATAGDPRVSADVAEIKAAAERAARLTRQLLTIGRREAIHIEILDLGSIVTDIQGVLARTIGEHIELMVLQEGSTPTIRADRGQVEQVLLNLALNARDAMPSGGVLTIATTTVDVAHDDVRVQPGSLPDRHVELTVTDTGVGMTPAVMEHIFEPFFTTKPMGGGTGLGLATAFSIVTEAGGTIGVTSEPGVATVFRVCFPAATSDLPASVAAPADEPIRGQGETVLIVEDEPGILASTARILRAHGYVVLEAASGTAALAMVDVNEVDLLLTDTVMPEMSGRELVARVKVQHPHLRVLFMSGYNQRTLGLRSVVDDRTAFLEKPFTADALLARVRVSLSA